MRTYVVLYCSKCDGRDIIAYAGNNIFEAEYAFEHHKHSENARKQTWINGEHVSTEWQT